MRTLISCWNHTVRVCRAGTLIIATICGGACQAWHSQRAAPQAVLAARPAQLRITRADGSRIVVERPALYGDTIVGTYRAQRPQEVVRIAVSDVRDVATRSFSTGRTVGLVAGVFGTFVVAAAVACSCGCCGGN
jgi:hypothetical protein